jgi:hypothetical protein
MGRDFRILLAGRMEHFSNFSEPFSNQGVVKLRRKVGVFAFFVILLNQIGIVIARPTADSYT